MNFSNKTNFYKIIYQTSKDDTFVYSVVYLLDKKPDYWFCINLDLLKKFTQKKDFSNYLEWFFNNEPTFLEIKAHPYYKKWFSKCLRRYNKKDELLQRNNFALKDYLNINDIERYYNVQIDTYVQEYSIQNYI